MTLVNKHYAGARELNLMLIFRHTNSHSTELWRNAKRLRRTLHLCGY